MTTSSRYRRKIAAVEYNDRRIKMAELDRLQLLMREKTGRRVRFVDVNSSAALDRAIAQAKAALETPVTKATSRTALIGGRSKVGVVLATALMMDGMK